MNRFLQYETDEFNYSVGEDLHFVMRRHWIIDFLVFVRWAFSSFGVVILLFIAFNYLGGEYLSKNFLLLSFGSIIYMIFVTLSYLVLWLNHAFDVIFVTNDRVIDISQIDFFHKNIIETRLSNIQDVTGDIKGFLNTIFTIGTIKIRTSNDLADFSISLVKEPQKLSRKIFDLVRSALKLEHVHPIQKDIKMCNITDSK
ncbi:TPA: hypothetical protein EYP45_01530 [Candidatus Peregrinibacteria bacterium]|nr:hypothetical protein [Candidatus Peregrinibacteria bacterium]